MTENQKKTFQTRIKKLREAFGLKQYEVADELYISRTCWTNYELGEREPNMEMMQSIAKLFGVDIKYLTDGDKMDDDNKAFMERKIETNKYLNKDGCLDLSTLSVMDKILVVDLYIYLMNRKRKDK